MPSKNLVNMILEFESLEFAVSRFFLIFTINSLHWFWNSDASPRIPIHQPVHLNFFGTNQVAQSLSLFRGCIETVFLLQRSNKLEPCFQWFPLHIPDREREKIMIAFKQGPPPVILLYRMVIEKKLFQTNLILVS